MKMPIEKSGTEQREKKVLLLHRVGIELLSISKLDDL
jgi:hypothetical protein